MSTDFGARMRRETRAVRHHHLVAAVAALVGAAGGLQGQARSYTGSMHALVLDGATGFVKNVAGGGITADVIVEATGQTPDGVAKKHVGAPRYEDIVVEVGPSLGKGLSEWIAASWTPAVTRKSGSIVTADYTMKVQTEREFFNAMVTETTFPALDASSKDAAYITVTITPEQTRVKSGSGADLKAQTSIKQKPWVSSNFRFEMDGLETSRVYRIESFTVRQRVVSQAVGERRDYERQPGRIEFPNIKVTLAERDAKSWLEWHQNFVVNGNNADDREKSGAIIVLTPDLRTELMRVSLQNCGIFRIAPEPAAEGRTVIARLTAEMYCERMQLSVSEAGLARRDGERNGVATEGL